MATLYNLTGDLLQLTEMAEMEDIDEEALKETFDAIEGEFEDKCQSYAMVMRQLDCDEKSIDTEIARLQEKKDSIKRNYEKLETHLFIAMKQTNKPKFQTTLFNFSIKKNPTKVVIDDESKVPECFLLPQKPKVDKTAIKKMLTSGEYGNRMSYAHLEQEERLEVK